MFRIGQKVVWVGPDTLSPYGLSEPDPSKVYTISAIYPVDPWTAVLLTEFIHPCGRGLNAYYFRPAVNRKTDISIFKKMLTPQEVMQ